MSLMPPITGLDHPVLGVGNMEAAHATYRRLGFAIPPRGSHLEWGTGNWCIMFERDYLELRGIVKEGPSHNLKEFLSQHGEGLMGVALGTEDAEATRRALIERGLHPQPVTSLTRNFELPEGWVQPRFSLSFLPAQEVYGLMSVVLCQHLTPELLRRPEWLSHPNGAVGVERLTGCVSDLERVAVTQRQLFGENAVQAQPDRVAVRLGGQDRLVFMPPSELLCHYPDAKRQLSPEPWLAAVTLRTTSMKTTEDFLKSRGVEVRRQANAVHVPAKEASGAVLEFIEM